MVSRIAPAKEKKEEMKRCFFLVALLCALSIQGQTSWEGVNMPWLPARAPEGVKCIREYEPSTVVMGKRTLISTTHYDRQGYEVSPQISLIYDTLGRLVRRVKVVHREIAGTLLTDPEEVDQIAYSPNGLVGRYTRTEYIYYGPMSVDTQVNTYQLVSATHQTGVGILRCMYLHTEDRGYRYSQDEEQVDTFYCTIVLDSLGRVILRGMYGVLNTDRFLHRESYSYLPDGRIQEAEIATTETTERLIYQYNHLGTLIGMNGRYSDVEEGLGDIIIRCLPSGVPIEKTVKWYAYDDESDYDILPEGKTLDRTVFDRRGNVVRREVPGYPVREYDYEYYD